MKNKFLNQVENIKIGDFIMNIYDDRVERIKGINNLFIWTDLRTRIYPKRYCDYIILTEEEAINHLKNKKLYKFNSQLSQMINELTKLNETLKLRESHSYYEYSIDWENIEEDINYILDEIRNILKGYKDNEN